MRTGILLSMLMAAGTTVAAASDSPLCDKWTAEAKVGQRVVLYCDKTGETIITDDNSFIGDCSLRYPEINCPKAKAGPVATQATRTPGATGQGSSNEPRAEAINQVKKILEESKARRKAQLAESLGTTAGSENAATPTVSPAGVPTEAVTEPGQTTGRPKTRHAAPVAPVATGPGVKLAGEGGAKQAPAITAPAEAVQPPRRSSKPASEPEKPAAPVAATGKNAPAPESAGEGEPEFRRLELIPREERMLLKQVQLAPAPAEPAAGTDIVPAGKAGKQPASTNHAVKDNQPAPAAQDASLMPLILMTRRAEQPAPKPAAPVLPTAAKPSDPVVIAPSPAKPVGPAPTGEAAKPAISIAPGNGIVALDIKAAKLEHFRFYIPSGERHAVLDLPATAAPEKAYTIAVNRNGIKDAVITGVGAGTRVIIRPSGNVVPRLSPIEDKEGLHLAVDMSSRVPTGAGIAKPSAQRGAVKAAAEQLESLKKTISEKGVPLGNPDWEGVLVAVSNERIILAANVAMAGKVEKQVGGAMQARIIDGDTHYYLVDNSVLR